MKLLLIYHGGTVPAQKGKDNIDDLWRWIGKLSSKGKPTTTFIANGGKTMTSTGLDDYTAKVFGISIIDAESLDDALKAVREWPELRFGGRLDILKEL